MPRTYTIPTFNLSVNLWYGEIFGVAAFWEFTVPARAPDAVVAAQLYIRQQSGNDTVALAKTNTGISVHTGFRMDLRLPAGTYLSVLVPQFLGLTGPFDIVECPAGSGYLYAIVGWTDVHKGFPNEYRVGQLTWYAQEGTPEAANRRFQMVVNPGGAAFA